MLNLKVDGKQVDIKFNYRLYMNLAGKESKDQFEKFDDFIGGLLNDNVDTILKFGVAASNSKLSMEQVADQLDERGSFDDVHAVTDEIIKGLCNAGFLTSKVREWMKYGDEMIAQLQKVYEETSKEDSKLTKKEKEDQQKDLTELEVTIDQLKSKMEVAKKRLALE